jgi:hypothetical protein
VVTLSSNASPVPCVIIASVTLPLAVSIVMTQTPLPVMLARLAWYGYSGKGALTAITWAAGNDNRVGVEELAVSGCAARADRFFTRVFLCTGMADVTCSSGGRLVSSTAGAGFRLDAMAAIFKLGWAFFFFGLGVGIASRVSNCSGRFAVVASCARAKGASASTTAVLRTARAPRWTRTRKSPTHVRNVKLPPPFAGCGLNLSRKRKSDFCWGVVNLFASLCFR